MRAESVWPCSADRREAVDREPHGVRLRPALGGQHQLDRPRRHVGGDRHVGFEPCRRADVATSELHLTSGDGRVTPVAASSRSPVDARRARSVPRGPCVGRRRVATVGGFGFDRERVGGRLAGGRVEERTVPVEPADRELLAVGPDGEREDRRPAGREDASSRSASPRPTP